MILNILKTPIIKNRWNTLWTYHDISITLGINIKFSQTTCLFLQTKFSLELHTEEWSRIKNSAHGQMKLLASTTRKNLSFNPQFYFWCLIQPKTVGGKFFPSFQSPKEHLSRVATTQKQLYFVVCEMSSHLNPNKAFKCHTNPRYLAKNGAGWVFADLFQSLRSSWMGFLCILKIDFSYRMWIERLWKSQYSFWSVETDVPGQTVRLQGHFNPFP